MKIVVECKFQLEVEVPDDWTPHQVEFAIEENGCPGTGAVGRVLEETMARHEEAGTCWACELNGSNKIVSWGNR